MSHWQKIRDAAENLRREICRASNLKENALERLSQSYSSHGFVIDSEEACALFSRVRLAEPNEQRLVQELGHNARFPRQDVLIENHTALFEGYALEAIEEEKNGEQEQPIESSNGAESAKLECPAKPNGSDSMAAGAG